MLVNCGGGCVAREVCMCVQQNESHFVMISDCFKYKKPLPLLTLLLGIVTNAFLYQTLPVHPLIPPTL